MSTPVYCEQCEGCSCESRVKAWRKYVSCVEGECSGLDPEDIFRYRGMVLCRRCAPGWMRAEQEGE